MPQKPSPERIIVSDYIRSHPGVTHDDLSRRFVKIKGRKFSDILWSMMSNGKIVQQTNGRVKRYYPVGENGVAVACALDEIWMRSAAIIPPGKHPSRRIKALKHPVKHNESPKRRPVAIQSSFVNAIW